MKSTKQRWLRRLARLIVFLIVLLLFTHFYAPRVITEIDNPVIMLIRKNPKPKRETQLSLDIVPFSFQTQDNLTLEALYFPTSRDTVNGTIILLHGIRAYKEHFASLAHGLTLLGFNAVALDMRAHGKSNGTHCTYGVKEKHDVSDLIDHLQLSEHIEGSIGIWGQSLGGAVALQAMAHDPRIEFGVVESAFASLGKQQAIILATIWVSTLTY